MLKLFLAVLLACGTLDAQPADLEISKHNDGHFSFTGKIRTGDATRFAGVVMRHAALIKSVFLDSPGGDVGEAIKIGDIVRAARLDTYVQPNATCASACFFIWLNGANRAVVNWPTENRKTGGTSPPGRLGLHRPYLTNFTESETSVKAQAKAMEGVRSYLTSKFVPFRLIDAMMARSSEDIYWVSQLDLNELGESSPDLQELYVARCGDNRRQLYSQRQAARERKDEALSALLLDSIGRINGCIDDLSAASRAGAVQTGFREILRR